MALLADLQSLAMRQSEGFDTKVRAESGIARSEGRLICPMATVHADGCFHGVEPHEAEDGSSSSSSAPYRLRASAGSRIGRASR